MPTELAPVLSLIVPTYNEGENVLPLYQGVSRAVQDFEFIFVDDNSSDGTAQAIQEVQKQDGRVKLVQRPGKMGLGSAIMDGFKLARGAFIGMMDGDLSHPPQALPAMLAAASEADIVVASRYVKGGRIVGWPFYRRLISRKAIFISHVLLHLPVRDTTSGFALYRRQVLETLDGKLEARGYKLLLEVLAKSPRARVAEVPITFVDRAHGKSKMNGSEVIEYLKLCWRLRGYQRKNRP